MYKRFFHTHCPKFGCPKPIPRFVFGRRRHTSIEMESYKRPLFLPLTLTLLAHQLREFYRIVVWKIIPKRLLGSVKKILPINKRQRLVCFVIPPYYERKNPPKAFDGESTGNNRVGDQPDACIISAIRETVKRGNDIKRERMTKPSTARIPQCFPADFR